MVADSSSASAVLPSSTSRRSADFGASTLCSALPLGGDHVGGHHDGDADPFVDGQVLSEDEQAGQRGEDGVHAHEDAEEALRDYHTQLERVFNEVRDLEKAVATPSSIIRAASFITSACSRGTM